jgi:hypothetical protein
MQMNDIIKLLEEARTFAREFIDLPSSRPTDYFREFIARLDAAIAELKPKVCSICGIENGHGLVALGNGMYEQCPNRSDITAPTNAPVEQPINDKAHPRFMAGYDAGMADGKRLAAPTKPEQRLE